MVDITEQDCLDMIIAFEPADERRAREPVESLQLTLQVAKWALMAFLAYFCMERLGMRGTSSTLTPSTKSL
jgi:hypothetical protein